MDVDVEVVLGDVNADEAGGVHQRLREGGQRARPCGCGVVPGDCTGCASKAGDDPSSGTGSRPEGQTVCHPAE